MDTNKSQSNLGSVNANLAAQLDPGVAYLPPPPLPPHTHTPPPTPHGTCLMLAPLPHPFVGPPPCDWFPECNCLPWYRWLPPGGGLIPSQHYQPIRSLGVSYLLSLLIPNKEVRRERVDTQGFNLHYLCACKIMFGLSINP